MYVVWIIIIIIKKDYKTGLKFNQIFKKKFNKVFRFINFMYNILIIYKYNINKISL